MLGFASPAKALFYFHTVGAKNLFKISSISKVMILAKTVAEILMPMHGSYRMSYDKTNIIR